MLSSKRLYGVGDRARSLSFHHRSFRSGEEGTQSTGSQMVLSQILLFHSFYILYFFIFFLFPGQFLRAIVQENVSSINPLAVTHSRNILKLCISKCYVKFFLNNPLIIRTGATLSTDYQISRLFFITSITSIQYQKPHKKR